MRAVARRVLWMLVAAMPVVWGNCPYWFVGYPEQATVVADAACDDGGAPARMPCCPGRRSDHGGDDGDCPMTIARRGSTPLADGVSLPPLAIGRFEPIDAGAPTADSATPPAVARGTVPPTGPPLDALGTVVLQI
jgi:hypothetical protein